MPFPVVHSLPGFSGCWQDSGRAQAPTNVDELADLTILGGRLQKEKMKIQQESRAQRAPVIAVRTVLTLVWTLCLTPRTGRRFPHDLDMPGQVD